MSFSKTFAKNYLAGFNGLHVSCAQKYGVATSWYMHREVQLSQSPVWANKHYRYAPMLVMKLSISMLLDATLKDMGGLTSLPVQAASIREELFENHTVQNRTLGIYRYSSPRHNNTPHNRPSNLASLFCNKIFR